MTIILINFSVISNLMMQKREALCRYAYRKNNRIMQAMLEWEISI